MKALFRKIAHLCKDGGKQAMCGRHSRVLYDRKDFYNIPKADRCQECEAADRSA